ncbi:uncharacterized protein LOC129316465 [Prosopis cineraria]|uniref:uncharacterized protein LOC129316465 n=1 Tax=Prosopis cineraria TaxID=364024 RepID=UPI00240F75BD|nr:uncharacterized protein LOC129316465 [Prosopis cineraria]
MKQHLAGKKGDAISCKSVPHDVRYQLDENLKEIDQKRPTKKLRKQEEDNPLEVDDGIVQEIIPPSKEAWYKADLAVVRWLYDCCIPMNAVNSVYYQPMIDAISVIGPGYKGPTYHAVRTKLLQDMKKEVQLLVDECRNFWAEIGCTIMADGWQDQRNRQLINFLVYCPRGMVFIRSIDASDIVKDAQNLCNLFMDMVAFVGTDNVVHLVTDNAVANKKKALDPVDYESIDKIEYWVMEEDDCSLLNIDEIERDLIYDDTVLSKAIVHQEYEEDNQQRGNVADGEAIGGLDLQLFSQEDVDSFSKDVDAFEPAHA